MKMEILGDMEQEEGKKLGDDWYLTEKALEKYLDFEHKTPGKNVGFWKVNTIEKEIKIKLDIEQNPPWRL